MGLLSKSGITGMQHRSDQQRGIAAQSRTLHGTLSYFHHYFPTHMLQSSLGSCASSSAPSCLIPQTQGWNVHLFSLICGIGRHRPHLGAQVGQVPYRFNKASSPLVIGDNMAIISSLYAKTVFHCTLVRLTIKEPLNRLVCGIPQVSWV